MEKSKNLGGGGNLGGSNAPVYKKWYFWATIVAGIFFIIIACASSYSSELTADRAYTLCSKAFSESGKLRTGVTLSTAESLAELDSFVPLGGDGDISIRSWQGRQYAKKIDFDCYIDRKTKKIYKLYVYYDPLTSDSESDGDLDKILDDPLP